MKNSLRLFLILSLLALFPPVAVQAGGVGLDQETDMDFGLIDFTGSNGAVNMGTNATLSYSGGASGDGIATAGSFRISLPGWGGDDVQIGCDSTATLTNGSSTVTLTNIEFVIGAGNRTAYGLGNNCQGLSASSGIFEISGSSSNRVLFFGGRLEITDPNVSGNYSTGNPGGNDITFEVIRL